MNLAEKFKAFSANQLSEPASQLDRVLLIDGLNNYIRSFAATPTMNDDGSHVGGITGFLLSLGLTIRTYKPSRVVIAFDGSGGSQRRRALFKDYKGSRRSMTKLNRTYDFNTLEEEKEAMKWQLVLLAEILRHLPVTIISPENVEADDTIAYLAQYIESKGGNSIIVSTDKDFLQLVNNHTTVLNSIKKKQYRPNTVTEDYGFHPNNFLLYRAVTGDKSDCIPGVEGIKEKTLIKYFPELMHGEKRDVEFLFAQAQSLVEGKKKPPVALQNLLTSRDIIERNVKLMRLDDVAMSGTTRLGVLQKFDSPVPQFRKFELTKLLIENKLLSAFGRFDDWVLTTFLPLTRHCK